MGDLLLSPAGCLRGSDLPTLAAERPPHNAHGRSTTAAPRSVLCAVREHGLRPRGPCPPVGRDRLADGALDDEGGSATQLCVGAATQDIDCLREADRLAVPVGHNAQRHDAAALLPPERISS